MEKYCTHCGKELVDGVCDCPMIEEEAAEEIKEDVIEKVEEETEEVKEDATEEIEEDVIEEIKEDVTEEIKEDVTEEIKEDVMEEIEADVQEEVTEEIEEDIKEEVTEEVEEIIDLEPKADSKMKKLGIKVKDKAKVVGASLLVGMKKVGNKVWDKTKKVSKKVWCYDKKVGKKMLEILMNPASEIAKENKELSVSYTIGAVLIAFIFITNLIDPIFLGYYWDMSLKAEIAMWMALIPLVTILMASIITFLFAKKDEDNTAFHEILASYCVASAPSTIFYVIGYLLSFKWSIAMIVCFFLSVVSWALLSTEVASHVLKARNRVYWVMFLITILTTAIVVVFGIEIVTDVVTGVLEVMNEYIQEVSVEFKTLILEMLNNAWLGDVK